MSKFDKIGKLSLLFDVYNELLTDIQREVFNDYYFDDMSLSEIAEKNNKSKATITDALKKTEEKLLSYEEKLNLASKSEKIDSIIEELEEKGNKDIATKLKNI